MFPSIKLKHVLKKKTYVNTNKSGKSINIFDLKYNEQVDESKVRLVVG